MHDITDQYNVTERVREVTTRSATCTHWLPALAGAKSAAWSGRAFCNKKRGEEKMKKEEY